MDAGSSFLPCSPSADANVRVRSRLSWLAIQVEKIMGFLFETFPVANQPRRESDGPAAEREWAPSRLVGASPPQTSGSRLLFASQHWPTDFWGSFGQCWLGRSMYRQPQRRAYLLRRQKLFAVPLGQQRPIKRLKQPFSQKLRTIHAPLHGPTIRDGRAHPAIAARRQTKGEQAGGSTCLRRGRGRQAGDGRNKSPSCFAVREGSICVPSRGESITCVRHGVSG